MHPHARIFRSSIIGSDINLTIIQFCMSLIINVHIQIAQAFTACKGEEKRSSEARCLWQLISLINIQEKNLEFSFGILCISIEKQWRIKYLDVLRCAIYQIMAPYFVGHILLP